MSGTTLLNIETALNSLSRGAFSGPVTLGTMTLTGSEVPSVLDIGGDHGLAVLKLAGGGRVFQPMGPDPAELMLGGLFTGPNAVSRAQAMEKIRDAGLPVALVVGPCKFIVYIRSFSYTLQDQGAVSVYRLGVERVPTAPAAATSSASTSALSSLAGTSISNAATVLTTTASNISMYAGALVNQTSTVLGQITPIANFLGAGGLIAKVQDNLTVASGLAAAGTNLAQAPTAVSGIIANLQAAGSGLSTVISQAGANLEGISGAANSGDLAASTASLQVAQVNGDILSAAVDAGAQVNVAIKATQLAAGQVVTPGVVRS